MKKCFFRRLDGHSNEEIFSGFSPDANVITYENAYWYGDDWDSLKTGVDYDFTKSFFEQFKTLLTKSPLPARSALNMINSEYCNEASECKDCYLCFNIDFAINGIYLHKSRGAKDSMDSYELSDGEFCYEDVLVDKSYRTFYSTDCDSCVDVWFSKGLRGCTNCFGCVNLRNKTNYFFNEPCSKDEYQDKISNFKSGSYTIMQEMILKSIDFWLKFPNKFYHGVRAINSTGECLFNSKNVKNSYYVKNGENLRYCQDIWDKTSDCYDYSVWGDGAENIYECMICGMGAYNLKFCLNCYEGVRNLEYCVYCVGSKNCFGCVGLYKKEYCILNKQYTKEEYLNLVPKIIEHMNEMPYIDKARNIYKYGEFFPVELSPFPYNITFANLFNPKSKEEIEKIGGYYLEQNKNEYKITKNVRDVEDNIKDVTDDILSEVIGCEKCGRGYKIIEMELRFLRKMKLPIPHNCPFCRIDEKLKLWVDNMHLKDRVCDKCSNKFKTHWGKDRATIVYCKECYKSEFL